MMEQTCLYECNLCKKNYATYKSLWTHNKKFHSITVINNNNNSINSNNKKYNCKYCDKTFVVRQYKWSHEKSCKKKCDTISIQNNTIIPNNTINNTVNNTINNNIINNITINAFGTESINKLSLNDIKKLAKQDNNAIIYIVDLLHFNEKYPENHNFCTTSLEGDYVSVYNKKTNEIDKINKTDFYDKVLLNSIKKINDVLIDNEYNNEEKLDAKYVKKLEDSVSTPAIYNKKHKQVYNKNINQISYNKKKMILDTWSKIKKTNGLNKITDYDSDSSDCTIISYLGDSDSDLSDNN
jgi:hypothetical protein